VSCAIHGRVVRVRNKVLRASPEGARGIPGMMNGWEMKGLANRILAGLPMTKVVIESMP